LLTALPKISFTPLETFDEIEAGSGVYVFARVFNGIATPIYIGEATNIRSRIHQHTERNVRLMNGIKTSGKGKKVDLYCTVRTNSTQRRDAMLAILQRGLIEHALSAGHDLLNVQLTKLSAHTVQFTGNRLSEQLAPRKMFIRGV
jgi:excinuclease UvrABC nuclease subunit